MDLNILWFLLIGTLFCVYFFLDGIDFGIGMLIPFLGKKDDVNRKMIYAIGPTWGASEVWLLTAGGAMFAAFPGWYATMFSGFYPALFILLFALILRGISIEFRDKATSDFGKRGYNIGIFLGNFLTPLLLVVALACLLKGVPIDENMEFTGSLFSLFSPFTVFSGVTAIAFFIFHGSVVLDLKLSDEIKNAREIGKVAGVVAIIGLIITLGFASMETVIFSKTISTVFAVVMLAILALSYILFQKRTGKILVVTNGLVIATGMITLFTALFPNVMVSGTSEEYNLTIYNISSGQYTLSVISVITLTLLPIVLGYTIWIYYIFSKKVKEEIEY